MRLTETALRLELPVVYLVDSAGARITDQVELFPGRRGAGCLISPREGRNLLADRATARVCPCDSGQC